jgi:hypothetical protein
MQDIIKAHKQGRKHERESVGSTWGEGGGERGITYLTLSKVPKGFRGFFFLLSIFFPMISSGYQETTREKKKKKIV